MKGPPESKVSFFVIGDPVPKQSFRFAKGGSYQPARVRDWQAMVAWSARQAMGGRPPIEEDGLQVYLWFTLGHGRAVDADNLSKAVLDGMNGIVWKDDRQVTELHIVKQQPTPGHCPMPGVDVQVYLPEEDPNG